jgi:HAD domain in Swiss Army Knife RNA repair proteins
MSGSADRPVIFLDVDGPLITFSARPGSRGHSGDGVTAVQGDQRGNPLLDRLDPDDGRKLLALGCDLVWATTWGADANEVISPRLGLPELPLVDWPASDDDLPQGLHWKTMPLTQWAAGRPFIWLDDEITDADRRWVAAHYAGKALLHRVDPHAGLTDSDFSLIRQWLAG